MFDHIIIQFAKFPQLGKVKTRLAPDIGEPACLLLHRQLLQFTHDNLQHVCDKLGGLSVLSLDGLGQDAQIQSLSQSTPLLTQQGDNLGMRMAHAIRWGLTLAKKVCIVGSDCPALTVDYFEQALNELDSEPYVFINAEDGGYVLLGATEPADAILTDVPWGSGEVMAVTLQRLQATKKQATILGPLWDVDRLDDFQRLQRLKPNWPND